MDLIRFKTDDYVIRTVTRNKIALENADDKRVV